MGSELFDRAQYDNSNFCHFFSPFSIIKNGETIAPIAANMLKIVIGMGSLSSATCGARTEKPRANTLHTPKAVPTKSVGNI